MHDYTARMLHEDRMAEFHPEAEAYRLAAQRPGRVQRPLPVRLLAPILGVIDLTRRALVARRPRHAAGPSDPTSISARGVRSP